MHISALRAIYSAADRLDARAVARHFAPDGTLQLGARPPLVGRQAIEDALERLLSRLDSVTHAFVAVYTGDDSTMVEIETAYRFRGRTDSVVLRGATALRAGPDGILEARIYQDVGQIEALLDAPADAITA